MRVLVTGSPICDQNSFKRLLVIAQEIGFMDRPAVSFGNWGMVGSPTPFRNVETLDVPIKISAHPAPAGPVTALFSRYIEADLANPMFREVFLEGLANDPIFSAKFIGEEANYGTAQGFTIRQALTQDAALKTVSLSDIQIGGELGLFGIASHEERCRTIKHLLVDASIHVTSALLTAERSGLIPVSDDPHFSRLIALRTSGSPYLNTRPRVSPQLGLAVAKAVIPDDSLQHLTIGDICEYRKSARDAYSAWSTEIEKLAAKIATSDPQQLEQQIPSIIRSEVAPRLVEYRNQMKAVRDKLFGDLVKKAATWQVPALSLSYVMGIDLTYALATFAAGLPAVVDYFIGRRAASRGNTMTYLIGISPSAPDEV